jgi:hypothetical protein
VGASNEKSFANVGVISSEYEYRKTESVADDEGLTTKLMPVDVHLHADNHSYIVNTGSTDCKSLGSVLRNLDKYFADRHFVVGARINKTKFTVKAAIE